MSTLAAMSDLLHIAIPILKYPEGQGQLPRIVHKCVKLGMRLVSHAAREQLKFAGCPLFFFLFVLISLNWPHQQLSMCSFLWWRYAPYCSRKDMLLSTISSVDKHLISLKVYIIPERIIHVSNSFIYLSLQKPIFDHNMWSHRILAMPLSSWISLYINVVCGNVTEVLAHA